MRNRVALGLLAAFAVAWVGVVVAVEARVIATRPSYVWCLVPFPLGALALGARSRGALVIAVGELVTLLPLHAFLTLLRAARLEGG
jgi:hypothetical protein